ncbi:MAG: GntR family transcriptional regulator [Burkholderiales bacterium]|nr:GntR family transcriptional regulator [Burkholderiales bacterium]
MFTTRTATTLVPLYRQVSNDLAQAILRGTISAGAAVPTEEALCAQYGVSRITVRKALDELEERHLVVRRRGVGTFATGPERSGKQVTLTGYIDEVLSINRLAVMRQATVRPPAELLEHVRIPDHVRLQLFEGVNYMADDAPLVHLRLYYPPAIARYIDAAGLEGPLPPIKHVERQARVQAHHAEQVMVPAVVTGNIAKRLKLKSGTPVLRAIRAYYDADGQPIEMFDAHYHPSHYRYTATLYPRAGSASAPEGAAAPSRSSTRR